MVGTSGSGKSTFSKRLAAALAIPYLEMDALFWLPNWQQPSDAEFFPKLERALAAEAWILDGNYTRTIPLKWTRTQMVIWLDFSFPRTLWQAVQRAVKRAFLKKELWKNTDNVETFRRSFFSRDSIILWTIKSYRPVRQKYERFMGDDAFSHIIFVRLQSPKAAARFLEWVEKTGTLP